MLFFNPFATEMLCILNRRLFVSLLFQRLLYSIKYFDFQTMIDFKESTNFRILPTWISYISQCDSNKRQCKPCIIGLRSMFIPLFRLHTLALSSNLKHRKIMSV